MASSPSHFGGRQGQTRPSQLRGRNHLVAIYSAASPRRLGQPLGNLTEQGAFTGSRLGYRGSFPGRQSAPVDSLVTIPRLGGSINGIQN